MREAWRSTVLRGPNRFGWPHGVRFEFGSWHWRWWAILRGGKAHRTGLGEPCVIYPAEAPDA